jgi:type VI secretion system protein ImpB
LLEARTQLSNLLTYMDGKTGAEELLGKLLQDHALMQSLTAAPSPAADEAADDGDAEPTDDQSSEEPSDG